MSLAVGASMDYRSVLGMTREEQETLLDVLKERAEAMNPNKSRTVPLGPDMPDMG